MRAIVILSERSESKDLGGGCNQMKIRRGGACPRPGGRKALPYIVSAKEMNSVQANG